MFTLRTIVEDYEARLLPVDIMHAGNNARGKAERERFRNGEEEFDVRVRGIDLPDGSALDIYVEKQCVGQIIVTNRHGRLRIESRNGVTVPTVAAGNSIRVMIDGAVILEGLFVED